MKPAIIDVDAANVEQTGFFCFMSKRKSPGWASKLQWLRQRFPEGLRLKLLKMPERGFIEYAPGGYSWRPVEAAGYMVIHCLWVVGRSKGKGQASALLRECIDDARRSHTRGVAMVVSGAGYMKWKRFLAKHGFEPVDAALPSYQLMALRFGKAAPPRFSGGWERKAKACGSGLTILRTGQCPYFEDATMMLLDIARKRRIRANVIELASAKEVRRLASSPFGTISVVIDGEIVPSHYQARDALLSRGK